MFLSNRTVTLNLYTSRVDVYHYAQWQKANAVKPSWWKNIEQQKETFDFPFSGQTMKHCNGFNELYKKAFFIPLWSDVLLGYSKKGATGWKYKFADEISNINCHPQFQRGTWLPETEYQHFKFNVPWMAECSHDVNFLYTNADYQKNQPFQFNTLNGIVNYRRFLGTDVNVAFKRGEKDVELLMPKNEILAMVVPLTDKKVKIKHHLVDEATMLKKQHSAKPFLWFNNGYQKAKKCPFHTK